MEHLLATPTALYCSTMLGIQTHKPTLISWTMNFHSNCEKQFRLMARSTIPHSFRQKLIRNHQYPRRARMPPDLAPYRAPKNIEKTNNQLFNEILKEEEKEEPIIFTQDEDDDIADSDSGWSPDELDAISNLFERPTPPRPWKPLGKEWPLPLPLPYKVRLPRFPAPKCHVRSASRLRLLSRSPFSDQVQKNPEFLVGIAREIAALHPNCNVSEVLDRWARFLRKGSLSMTVRELGHMGLPERALQTLCWAQEQQSSGLFPDDRTLASTVEVLARCGQLKLEPEMEKYLSSASRTVIEAMARGFISAGNLRRAREVVLYAKDNKRTLDPSIHAKLILEAGKTPDGYKLALALLDELSEREDFDLKPQDCTSIMKVCIKLGRFDAVESLFNWYKQSGRQPTVVMYTTVLHSRYTENKYREGLPLIWEMESSNCLLDLPAYRVIIRLFVALNDLARATQYFSKLRDAGFAPTYDIYRDIIRVYAASGRLAKCRQVCKEVEMAGLKLDKATASLLSKMES